MLKSTHAAPDFVQVFEEEREEIFRQKLFTLSPEALAKIVPYFWNLPVDTYLIEKYRHRRLSRFIFADGKPHQLSAQTFTQSAQAPRDFEDLEPKLVSEPVFQELLALFTFELQDKLHIRLEEVELLVHQIRILATPALTGAPSRNPRGVHKNGALAVGIVVVDRNGVRGGESQLFEKPFALPCWRRVLRPGDFLLFNDDLLWHDTTEIDSSTSQIGHRDVFVFSATKRLLS